MRPVFAIAKLVVKEIFRKKDFYVALVLTAVILFYAAQMRFYGESRVVRYLLEIGLLLIFTFSAILTVALAVRQYPSEIQNRTGQVLLVKPVSRLEFIAGKYLGSLAASVSCFVIFYGVFLGAACLKGGEWSFAVAAQAFILFVLNLGVLAAMATALSYVLTVSGAVTVSLVLYFLIVLYGAELKDAGWPGGLFYYLLPHFEFFDLRQRFIHGWEPVDARLIGILTAYAAVYVLLFLLLAWLRLRKARL